MTPFWQSKPPIYLGPARRESLHAQAPHRAGDGLASGNRVNLLERYDYPKESVETLEAKAREEAVAVEKEVNRHLKLLADLRGYRVDQILSQDGKAAARALSNDYVLSWTAAVGEEPPTVVVTYSGTGSHLGQLVDSVETPDVDESASDAK